MKKRQRTFSAPAVLWLLISSKALVICKVLYNMYCTPETNIIRYPFSLGQMLGPGAAALDPDLAEWRSGPAGRNKARRQSLKFCLSTSHDKLFSGVTRRAERNNTSRLFYCLRWKGHILVHRVLK